MMAQDGAQIQEPLQYEMTITRHWNLHFLTEMMGYTIVRWIGAPNGHERKGRFRSGKLFSGLAVN